MSMEYMRSTVVDLAHIVFLCVFLTILCEINVLGLSPVRNTWTSTRWEITSTTWPPTRPGHNSELRMFHRGDLLPLVSWNYSLCVSKFYFSLTVICQFSYFVIFMFQYTVSINEIFLLLMVENPLFQWVLKWDLV